MKRIFLTMFLAVLIQAANISIVSAVEYLDGNSNFPLSWGHAGYFEYVDLTSCTFVSNEGNFYEIAANYIGYSRMYGKTYGTRHFRQNNFLLERGNFSICDNNFGTGKFFGNCAACFI